MKKLLNKLFGKKTDISCKCNCGNENCKCDINCSCENCNCKCNKDCLCNANKPVAKKAKTIKKKVIKKVLIAKSKRKKK